MAVVIIDYQIRVISDEIFRDFWEHTIATGNDLAKIPELPGVCLHDIIGISHYGRPLDLDGLKDRIAAATKGETPTAVLLVKKGDTINLDTKSK